MSRNFKVNERAIKCALSIFILLAAAGVSRLEAQTNAPGVGLGANWVSVANSIATNQITIPLNTANGSVFFRLTYP